MSIYQVTTRSKTKRVVILGDTLADIISQSIEELSLPPDEYKIVLEDTGASISNIKILEKWTEKYTSPPNLMILPINESASTQEKELDSHLTHLTPVQSPNPSTIPTDDMEHVNSSSTDTSQTDETSSTANAVPQSSAMTMSEEVRRHERRNSSMHLPSWSWSELPNVILEKCTKKQRASKCERDLLVNLIAMYLIHDLKDRRQETIRTMASDICHLYPHTFADKLGTKELEEDKNKIKSDLLAMKISRTVGYKLSKEKPLNIEDQSVQTSKGKKRKLNDSITLDAHGCALWEPPLPPGETAETQRAAQEFLQEKTTAINSEEPGILDALDRSYASQRIQINRRNELIINVLAGWPILMESKYFLWHATKLLGKNVDDVFRSELAANEIIYRYMKYYQIERSNSTSQQISNIRRILKASARAADHMGNDDCRRLAIIPLICEYFKEDANQLYLVMDSTSTLEEMEASINNATPTLIVLGRSLYDREAVCRIFIEKKECVYVDNVLQGFLVVFLAYFVFGLKYPQKLKSTLEFIQRTLVLLLTLTLCQLLEVFGRHNHLKFRHLRHRRQHGEGYVPSSFVPDNDDPEEGLWGPWSAPTACSRTCGGGVAHQTRRCLDIDDNGYDRCTGAKRRFFSCNIQPCSNTTDFRAEQCAEFNTVPFEGVFYDWIPYTGGPKKCELNCMPRGERFFYRHKLAVIDGTPCDAEKNEVCVEGKCLPVGCDMMLGSGTREDACRECGGDGSECNTISGLFDTDDLQVGYIDILLIPEGATNIVVKEISPSNNYLAIRNTSGHYYLNGNWRIDFPRSLRFAGTIFHYARDPQGFSAPDRITTLGPTTEAIYIILLYQDHNVGVQYEYSIPKKFSPQGDPDSYTWTADEFSECSVTCGGGYQSRLVNCVRRRDNEPVDENLCDPQLEPMDTQSCNELACPPEWISSEWGPCSKHCGEEGERHREIRCQQIVVGGISAIIEDSICMEKVGVKGETTQECNRNVTCPQWHLSPWKPCDHLCGQGKHTRKVTCFKKNEAGRIEVLEDSACEGEVPEKEKPCELRPCAGLDWVASEWSGCEESCGLTQETRTAQCTTQDGTVYPDDKCDPEKKPELTRECENSKECKYQWYATQWSECSAKCGTGVQTRKVFCATLKDDVTLKKVEDDKCRVEHRHNDTKECTAKETKCKGEWFAGPWNECTKPCGVGDRTRKVICMKDNIVVSLSSCDPDLIMFSSEECNKQPCDEDEVLPVTVDKPTVPTDEEDDCLVYEDEEFVTSSLGLGEDEEIEWTTLDVSGNTDTTGFSDAMMSDSTRGDMDPTDDGSGYGSGWGSGDGEFTLFSSIYTETPISSSDSSTLEGSGTTDSEFSKMDTEVIETTGILTSGETEGSPGSTITPETSESSATELTSNKSTSIEEASGSSTSSGVSADSEGTTEVSEESEASEGSTELSGVMETSSEQSTTSGSSDLSSESSSSMSESSDETTVESTTFSDISDITTASSDFESDQTAASSSSEATEPTPSTESTETVTTEPSETTSSETETTESTVSEVTQSCTESRTDVYETESSSESSTVSSETTTSESTTEESDFPSTTASVGGEYDPDKSRETSVIEDTTESDETTETATGKTTVSSSEINPESSELISESSTESGGSTTESSTISGSEEITESLGSFESPGLTESSQTIVTGDITESGETTVSFEMTESSTEISESTTESGATTENETEGSTVFGETTESSLTTESEDSTVSLSTEEGKTEDEETDLTEKSSILDIFTTVSPLDVAISKEQKMRKCKVRRKKVCKTAPFGCCYDGITSAKGPFGKGCPTPETCKDTKYGCCPDGVSVAAGPKNEDCPSQHCNETLFGCCQDGVTPAEGNDFEGCKKPCNETEFGCCPYGETPAFGKNNLGCCNVTEYGCCSDGIRAATGPGGEGCEDEATEGSEWTDVLGEWETTTAAMEEDCANSTYGCCPDGHTSATGINFNGCGVINTDNCTESYFGCCPDNATAALGGNGEGCGGSCDVSTYGCCPDKTTPAHGRNAEGCCLTSPYGCCPDNIVAARGPNLYGCGCEYSRFHCCPDNTTAARGPNNEGCGCEYTQHGCCPNRFTPATGQSFEGCPCYTYQFGCCPDGITIAKGPHSQGCGCENTEFKCCSDERTPAKGPNFTGCTCDASKYGCCPDGIDEAQGENFEGCRTVPTVPGAACGLDRDRGSCRDFTVKWFFDTKYGGCSRFWYGGCEGNDNRFATQEECKDVCVAPKGKDICTLPKSAGPCQGYHPTWYYDAERKQCGQFIYGGCLGNANKFKTREECEGLCVVRDDGDVCEMDQDVGPCQGNFVKWFFNKDTQACEQFQYGGCKGNNNNFPTQSACHQQCLQPGRSRVIHDECTLDRDPGACPGSLLRWYYDTCSSSCRQFVYGGCKGNGNKFRTRADCEERCLISDSCSLPRAEGNCTEKLSRWFFDQSENRCMPFYYTGCSGNRNNFESRDACEKDCPPKIEQDICLLPALLGECHNYTQRWYFDSYVQRCRQFYYGGCGGNENNFVNEDDCINRCESPSATSLPHPQEFSPAMCFLPDERGPCSNNQTKWFYDSRDGICKQFVYGGCASNGNKFESKEECEYRCGEVQDVCSMPKVVGPCSGSVIQYYYERNTDTCEEFEYSGCEGNRNRFQDHITCENKCQRRPEPHRPTEVPPSVEVVPSSPICMAPADAGPCRGEMTTYYYDARSRRCQAFIYGGCGGNANRFQTEEQCERLCGRFQGQDMCNQPPDTGPCRGSFPKFYYDPSARSCRQFIYGGCDGNANRFSTQPECESVCIHREEPAPAGNDTALSHLEICRERVDVGSCPNGSYKRFYFDEERQTCMAFVYTGCGGNRNKFKTFESCMQMCYKTSNEIEVGNKNQSKDPCIEAQEECHQMRCPYGKEAYVDDQDCGRCKCVDPCRAIHCGEGTRCSIILAASPEGGTEYRGECRSVTKPGSCPVVSNSTRCEQECRDDADCPDERKCCNNGCGTSCLESPHEQPEQNPVPYVTLPPYGGEPAVIQEPEEPQISGEEGGMVVMKCIATGSPKPIITWRKDSEIVQAAEERKIILPDGSLRITNLYGTDRGVYICIADNGLAPPARTEYRLDITEPHEHSTAIVGEPNTYVTVAMNSPTTLYCYAMGWPRPAVTWWHGDRMLPLHSENYEQNPEYSLLIRSVTITNLGVYTCQAFNGIERPASWSVTLQALGPVYNIKPEHQEYTKYLVQPPRRPATDRPQYPYRPARTQASDYNLTYAPIFQTVAPPYVPLPVIPLTELPPARFKVPVAVNVSVSGSEFPVGSEISIGCAVDGYPIPRVLWFKNDDLIRTDGRVTISEANRLTIANAGYNDTGRYRCEAANEYSSDSAEIDINVSGIYIHPDCQDNGFFAKCDLIVKAKYCQHQYYAKFCCRSCTEAGQLPSTGSHLSKLTRKRRSAKPFF